MCVYKNVYDRMKNRCEEINGSKLRAVAIKINEYHKDNLYIYMHICINAILEIRFIYFIIQTYNLYF